AHPIEEIGIRNGGMIECARVRVYRDNAIRLRIGKRIQKDAVDNGEERRIRADAERQCNDRDDGEARRFRKDTDRVTNILQQRVQGPPLNARLVQAAVIANNCMYAAFLKKVRLQAKARATNGLDSAVATRFGLNGNPDIATDLHRLLVGRQKGRVRNKGGLTWPIRPFLDSVRRILGKYTKQRILWLSYCGRL